ncbi:MAG: hypothetical protein BGO05_05550 [Rhizobiales bacterium 63-7]|nr:hypothetical protein [Hyphomicrobiales bacterium]OJU66665.1 MAG: hypothetical protein BGO05_05550 [Rhizobiales bacterium 63-7]
MVGIIFTVARQIGVVGCVVLGLLAYYEGIPFIREIPFVDRIPVVREMIVGRVAAERTKAADAAREGYVKRVELIAAKAEASELRRQAEENAAMAEAARKQAATARVAADAARQALEKRIAQDNDPDSSRWSQHDLERLHNER